MSAFSKLRSRSRSAFSKTAAGVSGSLNKVLPLVSSFANKEGIPPTTPSGVGSSMASTARDALAALK